MRDCRFSSVVSASRPGEGRREVREEGLEDRLDGDLGVLHTVDLRHLARVLDAHRGGVVGRHHHGVHAVRAEGVHADGEHQRGVDAAREAQQHAREAVLVDVVAHAGHQRAEDRLLLGERRGDRALHGVALELDDVHGLEEGLGLVGEHALAVQRERGAVEHQLVLPAAPVHVEHRQLGLLHARTHDRVALGELGAVEGRGVDTDEDLGPGRLGLGRGLGEPQVLADGEAELAPLHLEHAGPVADLEVALLVEHAVVGQLLLEVHRLDAPAAQAAPRRCSACGPRGAGSPRPRRRPGNRRRAS